jgi:NADPH-dependent 2,4-dienoyl-CoA reductase/sulfur reductase-like enzyme
VPWRRKTGVGDCRSRRRPDDHGVRAITRTSARLQVMKEVILMAKERLVVIGGDAAGMSAASQARRRRPDDLDILVFERGPYTSYAA